jgi:hypothetical protein
MGWSSDSPQPASLITTELFAVRPGTVAVPPGSETETFTFAHLPDHTKVNLAGKGFEAALRLETIDVIPG